MKTFILKKNLSSGITALITGLFLRLLLPYTIKSKVHTVTAAVGPDYLPKLVIYGMILCGAGLIFTSLIFKKDETFTVTLRDESHVLRYFLLLFAYMAALHYGGFLISSLVFSAISMWLMECRNWKHYLCIELLVLVIFAGFKYGLHVPLPAIFP